METTDELDHWHDELSALWRQIAPWCHRAEPRERLWRYLVGLLSETARKNGWQLAETMHETRPDGMQRLLNAARWDVGGVRDELRAYVVERLGETNGVLIADETGFLKQGCQSAGVARQYSGTAGRVENQQIGVFLTYASSRGAAFIDRELYLPEAWASDPARCQAAGIPARVDFATKTELVQQMVARALAAAVPVQWFVGDAVYRADTLRLWLEARGVWYVVAIACTTGIWTQGKQVEVATLLAQQPASAWMRLSAGTGSQGERWYDWAWIRLPTASGPGMAQWIVARRGVNDPSEFAYYHAYAPMTTPLVVLAHMAGTRWVIEVGFAQAKEELGLDQYEVRQWEAWYRHVTLVLLAYAYLVMLRVQAQQDTTDHELVPWTVPEVRRVAHALAASGEERQSRLSWSHWRRRHQAVARRCHCQRRQSHGLVGDVVLVPAFCLPGIGLLTEQRWCQIQAFLPERSSALGRPSANHRRLLEAMLVVMHQGVSWREAPADIAPWQTVYTRFQQWLKAGIWDQILLILSPDVLFSSA
jgi:SRSO17 transposase